MENTQCLLTTFDNPFDPFEQFLSWFMFDMEKGYDSCGKVARIAEFSDDMTTKEYFEENERAIDAIIQYDFTNTYRKVVKQLPAVTV